MQHGLDAELGANALLRAFGRKASGARGVSVVGAPEVHVATTAVHSRALRIYHDHCRARGTRARESVLAVDKRGVCAPAREARARALAGHPRVVSRDHGPLELLAEHCARVAPTFAREEREEPALQQARLLLEHERARPAALAEAVDVAERARDAARAAGARARCRRGLGLKRRAQRSVAAVPERRQRFLDLGEHLGVEGAARPERWHVLLVRGVVARDAHRRLAETEVRAPRAPAVGRRRAVAPVLAGGAAERRTALNAAPRAALAHLVKLRQTPPPAGRGPRELGARRVEDSTPGLDLWLRARLAVGGLRRQRRERRAPAQPPAGATERRLLPAARGQPRRRLPGHAWVAAQRALPGVARGRRPASEEPALLALEERRVRREEDEQLAAGERACAARPRARGRRSARVELRRGRALLGRGGGICRELHRALCPGPAHVRVGGRQHAAERQRAVQRPGAAVEQRGLERAARALGAERERQRRVQARPVGAPPQVLEASRGELRRAGHADHRHEPREGEGRPPGAVLGDAPAGRAGPAAGDPGGAWRPARAVRADVL
ncbi:MAG: hypothetical protein EBR09_15690, partial [Proteobacteria bacterium]|nr:hypothetical protein [Pseudomonadota bacterium]